jgi:Enoyl-CoA hydratase/isomerase
VNLSLTSYYLEKIDFFPPKRQESTPIGHVFEQVPIDFYEGVRAALINKDQTPKWNTSTCEEVTKGVIDSYFAPLIKEEDWQIPAVSKSSRL